VLVGGEPVRLSTTEFELLVYLAQNRPHVLSRDEILRAVWATTTTREQTWSRFTSATCDASWRSDGRPAPIVTVRSVGYRFDEGAS